MKITFVVPDSMYAVRGGVKRIAEYASRLAKRGHDVFVLCPDKEVPDWLSSYRGTYKLADINRGYKDFETDVAVATGGRAGRRLGRMTKAKVKVFSVVMQESLNKPTEKHGKIIDRDRFLRDPYGQDWIYIANSSWMKEVVEKEFEQKCHLVLAPTNEKIRPVPSFKPKEKLWVLGYGHGDWKGGQRTADAVTLAKKTLPNLEMIHFSSRGVPRSRVLTKHWSNPSLDLLAQIYSAADLFCHSSRFEGFANCCMEAISCGTPVVSYRTRGIEDIVIHGKTGWIVDEFDTTHMARAIIRVLQDKDLYEKMKIRCIEKAREFSWDNAMTKLEQIFEERLNG